MADPARKRVFVVEDEGMIAMLLEDYLEEIGYLVAATAATLDEALAKAAVVEADIAILDINLAGRSSFEVADLLAHRGMPFVFATGYGAAAAAWTKKAPILTKPFALFELAEVLAETLKPRD
jgi:CheY-like chemotaxis protein